MPGRNGSEDQQSRVWHKSDRVTVVHIMGTVGVVAALIANIVVTTTYINKIESRVSVIEARDAIQRERDDRQDKLTAEAIGLLRSELQYLRQGIDQLLQGKR